MSDLTDAIRNMYDVFEKYPNPAPEIFDHVLHNYGNIARLSNCPLRELPEDFIDKISWRFFTTFGDLSEFKFYLPRVFEVHAGATDEIFGDRAQVAISKLADANWLKWPGVEQNAVRVALQAWWSEFIMRDYHPHPDWNNSLIDLLYGIATAEDQLGPYLSEWESACGVARENLKRFLKKEAWNILNGEIPVIPQRGIQTEQEWQLMVWVERMLEQFDKDDPSVFPLWNGFDVP